MPSSQDVTNSSILNQDGKIFISDTPTIPFIQGDGIGKDVWPAAKSVIEASVTQAYNSSRSIQWLELIAGEKSFAQTGSWLPQETIDAFHTHHIGIKGPLTTPIGEGIRSVNVALRTALDLYACLRPVSYYPGVPSPMKSPEKVHIDLFRENVEDLYVGIDYPMDSDKGNQLRAWLKQYQPDDYARLRFPDTSAFGIKPISKDGSERIVRAAIEYAIENGRRKVTIVHKGNIMKYTEGAFARWGYSVAEMEFPELVYTQNQYRKTSLEKNKSAADLEKNLAMESGKIYMNEILSDAMFERSISHPEEFEVVVTTNTNGDNLADALASMVGGIGISPGANINYTTGDAIFEATHGTAPLIAGMGIANPCSLILSGELMLRYMGWKEAADLIDSAVRDVIAKKTVTRDFYDQLPDATCLTTSEFSAAVINSMMNAK